MGSQESTMQLQTTATQVDFFPIGSGKRFVQRTTWHPGAEVR
ncbi:MAG: hypothetical protein CM15mV3_3090 [Caudoviricetes sp.]|nr:MAG: hypothetical protein CM15mV3_3090 [Caudoviricetes sp.]